MNLLIYNPDCNKIKQIIATQKTDPSNTLHPTVIEDKQIIMCKAEIQTRQHGLQAY